MSLHTKLLSLRPKLAKAAQKVYDEWEQDEEGLDDVLGSGGICDEIAYAIGDVLSSAGVDITSSGQDGGDHAWTVAYDAKTQQAFAVDIPCRLYESGAGYVWRKLPDVVFEPDDVLVEEIDYYPEFADEN